MQWLCALALLPVPFMTPTTDDRSPTGLDPFAQVKQMGRGVNIIGYDPIWQRSDRARFKEHHFERIRAGGFQTVRVNLHAFRHIGADNRIEPAWLETLEWVVRTALKHKLTVILDEHDFQAMSRDLGRGEPKLLAFWEQVAGRFKDAPDSVVFEILNEPNGALDSPHWNALLKQALAVIRKTNPTRNVVIGPSSWNSIRALKTLELPADDRHIIVTVHYYLPMEFTHQGAQWVASAAKLSNVDWGSASDRKKVESDFAGVQAWATAEQRPILLGEFGAYDKGPMDARVRYTSCVARTAESLGWAWTYWQFDSDFIVYDMKKDDWVEPIYKALVP
jgi:endoglucanase